MEIPVVGEGEIIPEGMSMKFRLTGKMIAFRRGQQLIKVFMPFTGPMTIEEITLPTEEELNRLYRGEA